MLASQIVQRTLAYFVSLFVLFGFSPFAYAELLTYLLFWLNQNQKPVK